MADASAPQLVLLGTAGGPLPSPFRSGISQAIVVGGRVHVVDCGSGVTRQLRKAGLLKRLHEVFLTHLHSDHDCDYFNLFLLGWPILQWNPPVPIYGPGPAGGTASLPEPSPSPNAHHAPVVNPDDPTPGLARCTAYALQAHAYDLNIRMRDTGRADLSTLMLPREIEVPEDVGGSAPHHVAPPMAPIVVKEDDDVRVTAILVQHPPVFPAFAFRFDTDAGAIVVSGDTAPCENLVTLARGADILVHEVFDDDTMDQWNDDETTEPYDEREVAEDLERERHLHAAHTPLSEVGKVAARAAVGRLVLTHFIPGDDTLPDEHWVKRATVDFDGEVVVGHDLMELSLPRR